jgi:flagellar protein FliS
MTYTDTDAVQAYQETQIKTAGQGQLIVMLYDNAVKNLDTAVELLKTSADTEASGKRDPGRYEKISRAVIKAQEIVTELSASLDFEKGGEIARNLFTLYTWFNKELLQANITGDSARITEVRRQINSLRSAWAQAVRQTATSAPARAATDRLGVNFKS